MTQEILTEEQVTAQTISELLSRAFIENEIDEDGDIVVTLDNFTSLIVVDTDRKLLKFGMSFTLYAGDEEQKNAYANRLNMNYIFASFYVRNDSAVGEYYLPFDRGVLAYHIIYTVRKMHDLVPDVLAMGDDDNLLGRDTAGNGEGSLNA